VVHLEAHCRGNLTPAKLTSNEDVEMPLAIPEGALNILKPTHKRLAIVDLLNDRPSGDLSAITGYDSDGSSDSGDVLDVPLRPKLNPISTITSNSHKHMRPDSSTDSNMESSDGYELSTNSFSSMEEK